MREKLEVALQSGGLITNLQNKRERKKKDNLKRML
jgi:hypothetical protein